MKASNLFFLLALSALSNVALGSLYGVITQFQAQDTEVSQWIANVNSQSGATKTIAPVFLTMGSGGWLDDAISAIDIVNNIYYYSLNFPSSTVYRVNYKTGQLLPPIYYTGAQNVPALAFDQPRSRLLMVVVGQNQQGKEIGLLVALPSSSNTPQQTLLEIPTSLSLKMVLLTTVGGNYLYLIAHSGTDPLKGSQEVAAVDLSSSTPSIVKQVAIRASAYPLGIFPYFAAFDAKSQSLVGFAEGLVSNTSVVYAMFSMDANPQSSTFGVTTTKQLAFSSDTIIVDAAWDPVGRNIYMNVASTANLLYTWSIAQNAFVGQPVNMGPNETLNLEWAPN